MIKEIFLRRFLIRLSPFWVTAVAAFHQRRTNKNFTTQCGVDSAVADAFLFNQHQTIESNFFERFYLPAATVIVELKIMPFDQMLSSIQRPFRLYFGHCVGV